MAKKNNFIPDWREEPPAEDSYRSIFKWGDPNEYKHPNDRLYAYLKEKFELTDDHFQTKQNEGDEKVVCKQKSKISKQYVAKFEKIVGKENIALDDYSRVNYSTACTMEEATRLRKGDIGTVADVVIHPRNKEEIKKIVEICNKGKIPIYVYGGGSSVTFGLRPSKGGVTLVMNTHMNKIIHLNEINQTVTVEAGMMGPAFEDALNDAQKQFKTKHNYTCGHFPQSFEYSSVGGWIVTLGSGQASSYYGDAYDLVIGQEYITPTGSIKTLEYPATATGPKLNDIMKGSEGSYGILTEVTLKVYRHIPENRQRYAFIFKTWEDAVNASREVFQGEFGNPAVFRISDPEETDMGLKLYGVEGTPIDALMKLRGFKPMERCLFLGTAEGEKSFAKNVKKHVKKICRKYGAMYITGFAVKKWEHGRYKDPYIREDMQDYGIVTDTLESGVSWDNLHKLHQGVRAFIKSRPNTSCFTHASHFYPQGTNLYFIFIAKMKDVKEYKKFQDDILSEINKHGGSLSHHHGVGKMIGPWMESHLGKEQMDVLRTLKKHFDPNNIMNPGGQLGLDLAEKEKKK